MIYLQLAYVFFKTGLFTIGGGLATLPLLYEQVVSAELISETEFYDMLAISQSTPGPIGINLATYVGYKLAGVAGAVLATLAMVTPSIIIIYIIARFIRDFNKYAPIRRAMRGFRPTAVGLIGTAAYYVAENAFVPKGGLTENILSRQTIVSAGVCLVCGFVYYKYKLHPIFCMAAAAITGMILL